MFAEKKVLRTTVLTMQGWHFEQNCFFYNNTIPFNLKYTSSQFYQVEIPFLEEESPDVTVKLFRSLHIVNSCDLFSKAK